MKILAAILVVSLVAITGAVAIGATGESDPQPGTLSAAFSFDRSAGFPDEGFVSYVEVRRVPGATIFKAELSGDLPARSVTTRLRPGRYRVRTYQRGCNGNCDTLDPPAQDCSRSVRVHSGRRVSLRTRVAFYGPESGKPGCESTVR